MSPLTQAMVINAVVLIAVLEADLGPHRKIGVFRIVRPLLMAAAIVPLYLTALTTHGMGLTLEIAGAAAGLLLGLLATSLMTVYGSPKTGKPASRAGYGYAAVWTVVIGARAAFSYGSSHWFRSQLGTWMGAHDVSVDAITNTLILMAIAMVLTRTIGMAARARALPAPTAVPAGLPSSRSGEYVSR
jgi:hypothetical protein